MNEPLPRVSGRVIPLDRADVDTDQIIPAHHLKRTARTGYGAHAFEAWRADPGFILNDPRYRGAPILVAGPNFGCGSSREHAAWALHELGIRAVLAPSVADIFRQNCINVGMVPVVLPLTVCAEVMRRATGEDPLEMVVDVVGGRVRTRDGEVDESFLLDPDDRHRLVQGLDPIGASLERLATLAGFEARRPRHFPTTGRRS